MKLALKTVCLKPTKACFQSDPYQFNEIKHYTSFHKFLKSIYQAELIAIGKAGKAFICCRGQILGSTAFLSQVFHILCA